MGSSSREQAKAGLTLVELLVLLTAVAILVGLAGCAIIDGLGSAQKAQCASNLSQIGRAMNTYAAAHRQAWPDVFTEESTRWDDVGNTRTDEWDPVTGKGRPPKAKPGDNGKPIQSNTANLWFLVAEMGLSPEIFICPSTRQDPDATMPDPKAVRDFRGETFVSYSYQNVLGEYTLTSTSGRASSMAVAADANPMRRDFRTSGIGEKKREGVTDEYLADKPQFVGGEEHIAAWNKEAGGVAGAWELNSPNHGFKGQNVLYLDGHVAWTTHPYVGPNWDNIWIRRKPEHWDAPAKPLDPYNIGRIRQYDSPGSYNGKSTLPADSTGDSFLVP